MNRPAIPLVDLRAQHREVADQVAAAFERVLDNGAFVLGPAVEEFEDAFARFSGVAYCVGLGNGTDALELIVRAVGIGPGDEVLVPANTFVATALAVVRAGARPVLVDCDDYHLMDPTQVEAALTARSRALLPVHLYGQPAQMEELGRIASAHDLIMLEDAAQAHGARRLGEPVGSFGAAAGVSFYPGKNLGAYGDAGAALTSSATLAARLRRLRNYGSEQKYQHPEIGFNSRLDSLQAVVLLAKLSRLADWNATRKALAARYDELLAEAEEVATPRQLAGNEHVWHLYVVRVPRRDAVLARLQQEGIGAAVHYPRPLHLHGAFAYLGYRAGDFPCAEAAASEILSLPLHPHLSAEDQERVVAALLAALEATRKAGGS